MPEPRGTCRTGAAVGVDVAAAVECQAAFVGRRRAAIRGGSDGFAEGVFLAFHGPPRFRYYGSTPRANARTFFVTRFPFLDWMRGLAVVVMIQCHTFNSFTRLDLREGSPYILSQFIGGLAAPLFLFMAGMTSAFQMDSMERREPSMWRRWIAALRRAGYILLIAFSFRFTNWFFSFPHASLSEMTKVDILNCMAVGMGLLSLCALFTGSNRIRFSVLAGFAIAAATPLLIQIDWTGAPTLLQEYLVPGSGRGRFPFFPWVAYAAFGQALGALVRRASADSMDRVMQWVTLLGFALMAGGDYFSTLPYSLYSGTRFWLDSPCLPIMRVGLCLTLVAASYLWTQYCAGTAWSWMQTMGKNSLQVYWIHVMIVYGSLVQPIKRALNMWQTTLLTVLLIAAMVAMSAAWLAWKARRKAALPRPALSPAG
jgi:uncharacterized membrane protein